MKRCHTLCISHRYGPGPFRILAIHGLGGTDSAGELSPRSTRRHRDRCPGPDRPRPVVVLGAMDHRCQRDRSGRSGEGRIRTPGACGRTFLRRNVALNLAAHIRNLVSGLVLLDPAVGLDGDWMRERLEASGIAGLHRPRRGTHREDHRFRVGRCPSKISKTISTNIWSRCPAAGTAGGCSARRHVVLE